MSQSARLLQDSSSGSEATMTVLLPISSLATSCVRDYDWWCTRAMATMLFPYLKSRRSCRWQFDMGSSIRENRQMQHEVSLGAFLCELSRRKPAHMPMRLDGEIRRPLPLLLYRVYEAPYTMEHRALFRMLQAILKNQSECGLSRAEIDA